MADQDVIDGEAVEEVRNLPAVRTANAIVARDEISVQELVGQADKIKAVMNAAMKEGVHYGKIPGVSKPTLLKPGAETLNVLLRLAPSYDSEKVFHDDGHLTVISKCTLTHIPTGMVIAQGEGLCSTREAKYAYRQGKRRCPKCGAEAIVRSQKKSAYFCISNEGGCGERYAFSTEKARELDAQEVGRVANPDLPDAWNTCLKMADKRALVAATLNGTAASDVFTQDVEDSPTAAVTSDDVEPQASPSAGPATLPADFDPGTHRHPRALKLDGKFFERFPAQLRAVEPSVDWKVLLDELGRAAAEDAGGDLRVEFWTRAANAVAKIEDPESFPPTTDAEIVEAFAWAFGGFMLDEPLPRKGDPDGQEPVEAEASEPSAGIPAPTEEQQAELDAIAFDESASVPGT